MQNSPVKNAFIHLGICLLSCSCTKNHLDCRASFHVPNHGCCLFIFLPAEFPSLRLVCSPTGASFPRSCCSLRSLFQCRPLSTQEPSLPIYMPVRFPQGFHTGPRPYNSYANVNCPFCIVVIIDCGVRHTGASIPYSQALPPARSQ